MPRKINVELSCNLDYLANDFDRLNQITATNVELSYSISDKPMNIQYGVEYLYVYKATMSIAELRDSNTKQAVVRWQAHAAPVMMFCRHCGQKLSSPGAEALVRNIMAGQENLSPEQIHIICTLLNRCI